MPGLDRVNVLVLAADADQAVRGRRTRVEATPLLGVNDQILCPVVASSAAVAGAGSYPQFAIAGLLAMNLATSAVGTAIGLSGDLATGVIDRSRTLPVWRPAIWSAERARYFPRRPYQRRGSPRP